MTENEQYAEIQSKLKEVDMRLAEILALLLEDVEADIDEEVLERCHREAVERRRQN